MTAPRSHPVLLHGFTGSSAAWGDEIVDGLAGAGCTPVLVDLPGHGRYAGETAADSFTLERTLALVERAGAWPADLIGYSLGARLALHFAAAYPGRVRRLVLESGSPGLATAAERSARRAQDEALATRIVENGVEAFVEEWEARPIFEARQALPAAARGRQRALRLSNHPGSLAASLRGLGTGALPSLWSVLPEIAVPTLLVVGSLDEKFVDISASMADRLPDARLVVVHGAGHTVHLERASDWLEAVTSFLRG